MKYENKLTVIGQSWVNTLFLDLEFNSTSPHSERMITRPENPFLFIDTVLYMRYDGIRIKPLSKFDGPGVEVGYYWNSQKVCIFQVPGISLDPPGKTLDLDGMTGSMKMVLVDN